MKKLLLTSTGLKNKNIKNQFLKLIEKSISEIKIIFVPAAARTEEEFMYIRESKNELLALGIPEKNIKTLSLDKPVSGNDIKDFDVIYVCGGNTFYLLQKIRASGFDKILKDFNGIYIGVSAGSIIVGPNIEVASPGDENDVELSDLTGLNIVDFAVSPHFRKEEQKIIDDLKKQVKYQIIEITDDQAVLVVGGEKSINKYN